MWLLRECSVQDDFALRRIDDGNLDCIAVLHLFHVFAQDNLRAFRGVCGLGRVGTCDLDGIGFLQNAITDGHDNAIAEYGFCFFCVRQFVKRETVLVILRKENRIVCECRRECATDHVCERTFLAGFQVLFDQVENIVAVAGENNFVVVNPVDITFVITSGTYNLEVCSVRVDYGNPALHIVKKAKCDAFSVWAELRTVYIIVEERRIWNENVNGLFGGCFFQIARERNFAQSETSAKCVASCKDDGSPLLVE